MALQCDRIWFFFVFCFMFPNSLFSVWFQCNGNTLWIENKEPEMYEAWVTRARELDAFEGRNQWKKEEHAEGFDVELVRRNLRKMKKYREVGDYRGLVGLMTSVFNSSAMKNIENEELYNKTRYGTKNIVQDYVLEIVKSMKGISNAPEDELSLQEKISFFQKVSNAFGYSALCLSSGATMAFHHFGVIRALLEADCMPRIISASSCGAMIAGWCSVRTNEELLHLFHPQIADVITPILPEPLSVRISKIMNHGALFDWREWIEITKICTKGDTTFAEAFNMSGRIVNISVTSMHRFSGSTVLNYINSPNVVLWSAILASAAIPTVFNKVKLFKKENGIVVECDELGSFFADGAIKNDLCIREMGVLMNASYFIVSQANPHIAPFYHSTKGTAGDPTPLAGSTFRGGFLLSALELSLRLEMQKWVSILGELDLIPQFFGLDWRNLLLQDFSGDCTIIANPRLDDFFNLISNPTRESMSHYLMRGQRQTWPKLIQLKNHFLLENSISDAWKQLKGELPALFNIPPFIKTSI